jgi:regulator of RNase E activity RraA
VTDLDTIRRLAATVDTTAVCDTTRDVRVMSAALRCRSANPVLCGPAVTVRCHEDFFGVIQALEQATPGDVLVVAAHADRLSRGEPSKLRFTV